MVVGGVTTDTEVSTLSLAVGVAQFTVVLFLPTSVKTVELKQPLNTGGKLSTYAHYINNQSYRTNTGPEYLPNTVTTHEHEASLLSVSLKAYVRVTAPSLAKNVLPFERLTGEDSSEVVTGGDALSELVGSAHVTGTPATAVVRLTLVLVGQLLKVGGSWSAKHKHSHT